MADTALEVLRTVVSVCGIFGAAASAFLLWDRFTKHRPVAIIVPRPLVPGLRRIAAFLWVKNASDRPILISWKHDDSARLLLAKDDSLNSVSKSAVGSEVVIAVGSQNEVFLPVIKSGGYDQIDPDNSLEISLRWRFAQPRLWNADRDIRVWVRKRDLDYMIDNYISPTDTGDA